MVCVVLSRARRLSGGKYQRHINGKEERNAPPAVREAHLDLRYRLTFIHRRRLHTASTPTPARIFDVGLGAERSGHMRRGPRSSIRRRRAGDRRAEANTTGAPGRARGNVIFVRALGDDDFDGLARLDIQHRGWRETGGRRKVNIILLVVEKARTRSEVQKGAQRAGGCRSA